LIPAAVTNPALIVRAIAVTLVAAAISGCWEGSTRGILATVLSCDGQATIKRAGGEVVPLTSDTRLGSGDIAQTSGSSRAQLSLLPNLLVQLDREARLEIVRLAITKDGNETGDAIRARVASIRLIKGRLIVSHVWGEAIARLVLATPHGELVLSSNALFSVETGAGQTRVTCVSGSLSFRSSQASSATKISPGFLAETSGTAVTVTPAETDASAQETLVEALEVEQELRAAARQKRNVLPR
jgi:hypothetical protein